MPDNCTRRLSRLGVHVTAVPVAAVLQPLPHREEVIYGRKFGVALTLVCFKPTGAPNGIGIIAVVSGGWKSSHDHIHRRGGQWARLLSAGYSVFAVVHGSAPKFSYSEIVQDVHRAVRFVRYSAKQRRWDIEPERLGIVGSSAGGSLALTIATQTLAPVLDPEAADPVDRESSEVQCAAAFFPPTSFIDLHTEGDRLKITLEPAPNAWPLAKTQEERASLGPRISPVEHVTSALPPIRIIHGDSDASVPLGQSRMFVAKAACVSGAAVPDLIVREDKGHGWPEMEEEDWPQIQSWFDVHLLR